MSDSQHNQTIVNRHRLFVEERGFARSRREVSNVFPKSKLMLPLSRDLLTRWVLFGLSVLPL